MVRNAQPAVARWGGTLGTLYAGLDMWLGAAAASACRGRSSTMPTTRRLRRKDACRADRLSQARRRADLRPPVVGVRVQHQSRGRPAGSPDAQGRRHTDRGQPARYMPGPSSVIARRAFMNLSRETMASRGCRSTRRIASTARPATSRTRPRTSTGSRPKAEEGPITRTCKLLGGADRWPALVLPRAGDGRAQRRAGDDPALTYVQARAAAMNGDHARSAELLARAGRRRRRRRRRSAAKALAEALGAGRHGPGAARWRAQLPPAEPADRRAAAARRRRDARAAAPTRAMRLLAAQGRRRRPAASSRRWSTAWAAAERARLRRGARRSSTRSRQQPARPVQGARMRAFILLKSGEPADAEPFARRAIGNAGGARSRLRLALADGFLAAGDRARALAMLDGMGAERLRAARSASRRQARSAWRSTRRPRPMRELLLGARRRPQPAATTRAADRPGPGRALRRSRTTAARRCCWRCCSRPASGPTRRSRMLDRSRPATRWPPGPRRRGAHPGRREALRRGAARWPRRRRRRRDAERRRLRAARRRAQSAMKRYRRGGRRLWPGDRAGQGARASQTRCGRCICCSADALEAGRPLARGQARRSHAALALAPDQPLILNSSAMPSSSAARTSTPPRR